MKRAPKGRKEYIMILTFDQIKEMTRGVERIVENENGFVQFFRFSADEEKAYSEHPRAAEFFPKTFHSACVRWAFYTDSSYIAFDFSNGKEGLPSASSSAHLDLYENGTMVYHATAEYKTQPKGRIYLNLTQGKKLVEIYFHYGTRMDVANVELADGSSFEGAHRKYKMLSYGDSITHGSSCTKPSLSYLAHVARLFDADVINKGIGGEEFFPNLITATPSVDEPDFITVAYGTNDWKHRTQEMFEEYCAEFFTRLTALYPTKPIFVITPTWRADGEIVTPFAAPATEVHPLMSKIASRFENITVIRGWDLVPHEKSYFSDSRLHPNDLGFGIYTMELYRALLPHLVEKIGFTL